MAKPILSPKTMAGLRTIAERAMLDSATFSIPGAPTSNGRGGETPGTPTTQISACRFVAGTGSERDPNRDALTRAEATAQLWLPLAASPVPQTATITSLTLNGVRSPDRWQIVYAPTPDALSAYRLLGLKQVS